MARGTFSSGNTLQSTGSPITAFPFTMACWSRTNSVTTNQTMFWMGDKDSATIGCGMRWSNGSGGAAIQAYDFSGSFVASTSAGAPSNDTWHHVAGVFTNNASRTAYLDGTAGTTATTSLTDASSSFDRVSIGYLARSSPLGYMTGYTAYPAIWNVALSAADLTALANRAHPTLIKPQNLVWWCGPLTGTGGNVDVIGGVDLAKSGSVGEAESITVPMGQVIHVNFAEAVGGGTVAPLSYHHRHHNLAS